MDIRKIERVVRAGRLRRPGDRGELARWAGIYAGLHLPARGVCERHQTPLDYLEHVFFEVEGEAVVWACRGGGKTKVGAVATLLDMLFKPGVQVRILGGSREQSEKMYAYLCDMVKGRFEDLVVGRITKKGFALSNGSRVEILAQSLKAVRGTRVQKLRCDEVELFDEEVWKAAQLTTRSMTSGQSSVGSGQNAERRKTKDERRKEGEVGGVRGGSDGTGGTGLSADKPVAPAGGAGAGECGGVFDDACAGRVDAEDCGGEGNAKCKTRNAKRRWSCAEGFFLVRLGCDGAVSSATEMRGVRFVGRVRGAGEGGGWICAGGGCDCDAEAGECGGVGERDALLCAVFGGAGVLGV